MAKPLHGYDSAALLALNESKLSRSGHPTVERCGGPSGRLQLLLVAALVPTLFEVVHEAALRLGRGA